MRFLITFLTCLTVSFADPAFCQDRWAMYTDISSFSYCEPYTINGIFNDLEGGLESGDLAFTFDKAEVGVRKGNWEIGAFMRYDYYLEATSDLVRLYYQKERDLPLDTDYLYEGAISASHIRADGLSVAYTWKFSDSFWFKPRLNLLYGSELIDGELHGNLTTAADGSYSSTASVDYYYSEDILFDRQVEAPTGKGISFDLHAGLTITPNTAIEILIEDVWSKIRWEDAPHTSADGDTDTVLITDEGYLKTKALLSGIESNSDFDQDLPLRARVNSMLYLKNADALLAELFIVRSFIMPRLGYAWHFSDQNNITFLYDFMGDALGVRLKINKFKGSLIADSLDKNKAHTFGFSLSYMLQFF